MNTYTITLPYKYTEGESLFLVRRTPKSTQALNISEASVVRLGSLAGKPTRMQEIGNATIVTYQMPSKEIPPKTVFVFVKDACVEDVVGAEDFKVIDFDVLESGDCPLCGHGTIEITGRNLVCKSCGVDWDETPDYEDLISIYQENKND